RGPPPGPGHRPRAARRRPATGPTRPQRARGRTRPEQVTRSATSRVGGWAPWVDPSFGRGPRENGHGTAAGAQTERPGVASRRSLTGGLVSSIALIYRLRSIRFLPLLLTASPSLAMAGRPHP